MLPKLRALLLLALALALAGVQLAGCRPATRPLVLVQSSLLGEGSGPCRVEYTADDQDLATALDEALAWAAARVRRWGGLPEGVILKVYPSHSALEDAIGHHGFPWLRAWAQYRVVHLESPSGWGIGPFEQQLRELLAHELTHVAMYQSIGGPQDWAEKEIPLWFREGMASTTAGQGYRRGNEEQVAAVLLGEPDLTPLDPDLELLRHRKDLVYNASHWAFGYLLALGGEEQTGVHRVRELLDLIRGGYSFDVAFEAVWGITKEEFVLGWYRYLGASASLRPTETGASPPRLQAQGAGPRSPPGAPMRPPAAGPSSSPGSAAPAGSARLLA